MWMLCVRKIFSFESNQLGQQSRRFQRPVTVENQGGNDMG